MNSGIIVSQILNLLRLLVMGLALALALALVTGAGAADLPEPVRDDDYRMHRAPLVDLGRMLFYDRVLSGTYRVSCATCHNPDRASSNGFAIAGVNEVKGDELAINGLPIYDALKPSSKHAPPLFNLGAREFQTLFGDGRVARQSDGSFTSPAGDELPEGLHDVLAVQALFPAVTGDELVGTVENDVSAVAHLGNGAIWDRLARRVEDLPGYQSLFAAAYPDRGPSSRITMVNIANALSAFVAHEWRSDNAVFDAYLRGDRSALSEQQKRGMELFFGKANCSTCHSGTFQTDHGFHAVTMPLWRFDADLTKVDSDILRDRFAETGNESDRHKRRTPSLRNVEHTAPYGHAGSYKTLEEVIRAHLDPVPALRAYVGARVPSDNMPKRLAQLVESLAGANELSSVKLSSPEVEDLLAFLTALSEPAVLSGRQGRPDEVPSFLALD